jgi:hypothetical protein
MVVGMVLGGYKKPAGLQTGENPNIEIVQHANGRVQEFKIGNDVDNWDFGEWCIVKRTIRVVATGGSIPMSTVMSGSSQIGNQNISIATLHDGEVSHVYVGPMALVREVMTPLAEEIADLRKANRAAPARRKSPQRETNDKAEKDAAKVCVYGPSVV